MKQTFVKLLSELIHATNPKQRVGLQVNLVHLITSAKLLFPDNTSAYTAKKDLIDDIQNYIETPTGVNKDLLTTQLQMFPAIIDESV